MKKMKHLFLGTLLLVALVVLMNVCAFADFSGREADVLWSIDTSDGTLTISGSGQMAEYDFGKAPWYEHSAAVKSIVVKPGISYISYGAFYGMEYVESITVPFAGDGANNTFVGYIFGAPHYYDNNTYLPVSLKTVTVTNAVSIDSYAFNNCHNLEEIILGDSVEIIMGNAFNNCNALERIVLGSNTSSVYANVFNKCTSLEQVFYNGTSSAWKNVYVATSNSFSPIALKDAAFTVTPPAKTTYELGEKFSSDGIKATYGGNDVTAEVVITAPTMNAIGTQTYTVRYGALVYTGNVTVNANETSGVTGGISWSFDNATGTLTLSGKGVTDDYTLEILPSWYQFRNDIKTVVVSEGIEALGDYVFYSLDEVETITIANSVDFIGYAAFEGCSSLTSLTIGNTAALVDATAFRGCAGLVVEDTDGNEYIAISGNDRYLIKSIADKNATSFSIPATTVVIGEKAFEGCTGITNVTIPATVTSIGDAAFRNCSSIERVDFGTLTRLIGNSAFADCTSLTEVNFAVAPQYLGVLAFSGCPLNTTEYNNAKYIGSEINPYMVLVSAKDTAITSCTLNPNTQIIAPLAFANCKALATVVLNEGLKVIGDSAFNGCSALYSIDFPFSTEYIGSLAFNNCSDLAIVNMGSSVEYIGNGAFKDADSLKTITLPFTLKRLGYNAFRGCDSLETVGISTGLKTIGYKTFEGCTSLENVFIPDSVLTIGEYAFKGCTSLQNIAIPHTSVAIGFGAFGGCEKLANAVLPFVGERAEGKYPFIGYVFGTLTADSNKDVVPEALKTVLVGGNVEADAFNGVEIDTLIIDKTTEIISANAFDAVNKVYYIGTSSEWSAVSGNNSFSSVIFLDNTLTITPTDKEYQVGDMVDLTGFTAVSGALDVMPLIRLGSNPLVVSGDGANVPVYLGSLKSSFKANIDDDLSITKYSLTLEGSIGIKAYVKLTPYAILNFDDIEATVTYKGEDYPVSLVNAGDKMDKSLYYAKFYVSAKDMHENITFTVETSGATETATVSVKTYVDYINENSGLFTDSVNLINAMYNYGEYSRAYFTDADITPDPDLSNADVTISPAYSAVKVGKVSGIAIYSSSLLLESNTTLRHYFKLAEGASIDDYTFTVDGTTPLTPVKKDNYYYIDVKNILAHKLGELRVVTVSDGVQSAKFVYGPFSYVKAVLEDNLDSNRDLKLVVKALYNYYIESRKYFEFINKADIVTGDNESGFQIW